MPVMLLEIKSKTLSQGAQERQKLQLGVEIKKDFLKPTRLASIIHFSRLSDFAFLFYSVIHLFI